MNWTVPLAFLAVFLVTLHVVRGSNPSIKLRYLDDIMGVLLLGSFFVFVVTVIWWGVTA